MGLFMVKLIMALILMPGSFSFHSLKRLATGPGLSSGIISEQFPHPPAFEPDADGEIGKTLDQCWKLGICTHRTVLETSGKVRRFKFQGDLCVVALLDGKILMTSLINGQVLTKFRSHETEITALDYKDEYIASGDHSGLIRVCSASVTNLIPASGGHLGEEKFALETHQGAVTCH